MATSAPQSGTVVEFNDGVGLGLLRADDSGANLEFHCTALLDGSRTVEVGARVEFELLPGHGGRLEANRIRKFPSNSQS